MVPDKQFNNSKSQGKGQSNKKFAYINDSRSNPQAERIIISSLLKNSKFYYDLGIYLIDDDFTIPEYAKSYYIIKSIYESKSANDNIALTIFQAKANEIGFSELINDDDISELFELKFTIEEFKDAFLQVKKETIRRKYTDLFFELGDYLNHTDDKVIDLISNIEEKTLNIAKTIKYGNTQIINLANKAKSIIDRIALNPGRHGVDIGFPIWQKMIGEIQNGTVHLIIADTKIGKSYLGLRSAIYAASKRGLPVLFCDSEMDEVKNSIRAISIYFKIPSWILETGYWKLNDDEIKEKLGITEDSIEFKDIINTRKKFEDKDKLLAFEKLPLFYLKINGMSVLDTLPLIRQWIIKDTSYDLNTIDPYAFLVYDYIKLSHANEINNGLKEYQVLGLNASALHDFCEEYNLPCITFGQVNREIDRKLNMIAGSKRLAELVDSISILAKKNDEELRTNPNGTRLLQVDRTRSGADSGGNYINMAFNGCIGEFKELGFNDSINAS